MQEVNSFACVTVISVSPAHVTGSAREGIAQAVACLISLISNSCSGNEPSNILGRRGFTNWAHLL